MGGKIDGYLDCVSPYSYYAFLYLRRNRKSLAEHGVEVEFHPVFLGGINVASGNQPPWMLPARANYLKLDGKRARKHFGVPEHADPPFFPILSILVRPLPRETSARLLHALTGSLSLSLPRRSHQPQRCMVYIKDTFAPEKFETVWASLWTEMFQRHVDISRPDLMARVLGQHFDEATVGQIVVAAGTQRYKDALTKNTETALAKGAYGAPWFWVRNDAGEEGPFFGSDRFHFMWDFLGLPVSHLAIEERRAKL